MALTGSRVAREGLEMVVSMRREETAQRIMIRMATDDEAGEWDWGIRMGIGMGMGQGYQQTRLWKRPEPEAAATR